MMIFRIENRKGLGFELVLYPDENKECWLELEERNGTRVLISIPDPVDFARRSLTQEQMTNLCEKNK